MISVSDLEDRPLFVGLGQDPVARLLAAGREVTLAAGKEVVIEGEAGGALYVLLAGEVEVLLRTGRMISVLDGKLTLLTGEVGDFFGEMTLFDDQPRVATVRTLTAVRLFVIEREALFSVWSRDIEMRVVLLTNMVRILSRRYRRILDESYQI